MPSIERLAPTIVFCVRCSASVTTPALWKYLRGGVGPVEPVCGRQLAPREDGRERKVMTDGRRTRARSRETSERREQEAGHGATRRAGAHVKRGRGGAGQRAVFFDAHLGLGLEDDLAAQRHQDCRAADLL
eukprot:3165200-Prymnesium_polylepis.2